MKNRRFLLLMGDIYRFLAQAREDISNSPAFNGKASSRERREAMQLSSAMATSVSTWPESRGSWGCNGDLDQIPSELRVCYGNWPTYS